MKNTISKCNGGGKLVISHTGRANCPECGTTVAVVSTTGEALFGMLGVPGTVYMIPEHTR